MPEGPETHRMSDNIKKSLKGKNILSFKFEHKALYPLKDLKHIAVVDVYSLGKAIIIRLKNDMSIISHNQLYGKWTFNRPSTNIDNNRQLRLEFITKAKAVRLWSATDISLYQTNMEMGHPYLSKIGPDVLDINTNQSVILSQLRNKKGWNRQLGSLLLDQTFISGIGNYLRSEILFFSGLIHTKKPSQLDKAEISNLAKAIKNTSIRAYKQKGKTVDLNFFKNEFGNIHNFKRIRHMVFSREGLPCFCCGEKIIKLTATSRRIFICPVCQNFN